MNAPTSLEVTFHFSIVLKSYAGIIMLSFKNNSSHCSDEALDCIGISNLCVRALKT